jgi:hypothetical protein
MKHLKLCPHKITGIQEVKTTDYAKLRADCDWFNQFTVMHGVARMDLLYYSAEAWFQ